MLSIKVNIINKQPFLITVLFFIFGILIGNYFSLYILYVAGSGLFLWLSSLLWRRYKVIGLVALYIGLGSLTVFFNQKEQRIQSFRNPVEVKLKLLSKQNSTSKYKRYIVEVENVRGFQDKSIFPFNTIINIPKDREGFNYKNYYYGKVYINKILPPTALYGFDYQKFMHRKDVDYQAFSKEDFIIQLRHDLSWIEKIKQCRLYVLTNIDRSALSNNTQEFLKGLILADRTDMDTEVLQDFTKTGLVHFLAISGTHMVVIFWVLMFILKPVFPAKYYKIPIIIALCLIWIFGLFIDFGSSVLRSCLMITIYYIMVLLERKPDLLHSMSLSAFIILCMDPFQIFDVGFQLSFLAVTGIYFLNKPILNLFPKTKFAGLNFLVKVLAITLSAQIITLPLILFYFHQFSFVSLVANLIIVPVSEIIIIFSLMMVVLFTLNIRISFLEIFYDFVIQCLLKFIHFFSKAEEISYENIPFSIYEMGAAFLIVIFLRRFLVKRGWKNLISFAYSILFFLTLKLVLDYWSINKEQAFIHHYLDKKIVSIQENGKVSFYFSDGLNVSLIKKYIIDPYLSKERIADYEIHKLEGELPSSIIWKNEIFEVN